jgi:dihydroneopterin aldolase
MTLMLASVASAEEAGLAAAGGADIVDFKDPTKGAIAAASPEVVEAGVRVVARRAATSATLGDPPYDAASLTARARRFRAAGVDMLKLAVDGPVLDALAEPLAALAGEGRLIGMLFADEAPDFALLPRLAALGFSGAMLDTRAKGAGRLIEHLDVARLAAFVAQAQALGLTAGLAGSLEPPDIPRLLLTGPYALGFRGALCKGRVRGAGLDPQAFALVRDLIPRDRPASDGAEVVDLRQLGRGLVGADESDADLDRIFVRDFGVEADIGAYDFERGVKQRVAFDVEAWVGRAGDPNDLRSIFSYDVIMDAIRLVVAQGHHEFVEGLAEAVAALVLAHPRARAVRIVARKLDVIAGAVGVEIVRRRTGAAVTPLPFQASVRASSKA